MSDQLTSMRVIAPITDFSDSTVAPYVLARSGQLDDVLPHDHLAVLAMTGLDAPWGPDHGANSSAWEPWAQKLTSLALAGAIEPRRSDHAQLLCGFTVCLDGKVMPARTGAQPRYFLHREDVAPHLSELGVDSASGLSLWALGKSAVVPEAKPEAKRHQATTGIAADIKQAIVVLEAGRVDWSRVSLMKLADFLHEHLSRSRSKPLDIFPKTIRDSYLDRNRSKSQGLEPPGIVKGRQTAEFNKGAEAELERAWATGERALNPQEPAQLTALNVVHG